MKSVACCFIVLLCSCEPQSFFKSPNNVSKKEVRLYLRDRPPLSGILTIIFEDNFNGEAGNLKLIQFIPEGKNVSENIDISEVIGYAADNNYYALKKIDLFVNNQGYLIFVKRLTTEKSRIQLYELYESGVGNATGEPQYAYFISLPDFNQYETINTRSNLLVPMFDEKMGDMVSDCPSLARKIRNKEHGYFIPNYSFNTFKHRDVMMKIIDEYNQCSLTAPSYLRRHE